MTPKAQRIAIAEACGWKPAKCICPPEGTDEMCPACIADMDIPPDYLNDLNAMHEAEKMRIIGTEHESNYCMELYENAHQCFATAAQRTEAFLRTIEKWTDG